MKAALLLIGFASAAAGAAPATYEFDPDNSFVHFEVRHFGTSTLMGRFGPLRGRVTLDAAASQGDLGLRVHTSGVATGVRVLDARLREADLLASETYPEAFYVARQFRFEGGRPAELRGEFTLRGIGQGLTLKALRYACRDDDGVEVCGGDFEGRLLRSDFGITFGLPLVGDEVILRVQVEGRRQLGAIEPNTPVVRSAPPAAK